jgi:hypothetical protein
METIEPSGEIPNNDEDDRYDFAALLSQLAEIDEWLKSRGFNTADRFRRYAANIREMTAMEGATVRAYKNTVSEEKAREILWSYVEADEFVRAIASLRAHMGQNIPDAIIERALHGPPDLFLENDTNAEGRNFMFELILGGRLAAAHLNPAFEEPDIRFKFAGLDVAVQCKRPLNEPGLERNIHKGVKQLGDVKADLRLIALSVSRILLPGDPAMMPDLPHPDLAHAYLENQLQQIAIRSKRFWEDEPNCDGILFYAYLPVRSRRPDGTPFFASRRPEIIVPRLNGSPSAVILKCLAQAIGK